MTPFEQPVRSYMSSPVHCLPLSEDVQTAERRMRELGISSLAITSGKDHHLVGVLSRTDLLGIARFRAEEEGGGAALRLPHDGVAGVMHRHPICIGPDEPLSEAARRMLEHQIHRVFVKDGERLVGVVTTRHLLRAVAQSRMQSPIAAFMSAPIITIETSAPLSVAVDRLAEERVRGLVVVEGERPVGLFTQVEALLARDQAAATPVEEVMSCALLCLPVATPLDQAAAHMEESRARRVVAVEHRQARGVLTGMDLACAAMQAR